MKTNSKDDTKGEILYHASKCMYFNDLLIQQCNSWLPAKEANRKMEAHIIERKKRDSIDNKKRNKGNINILKIKK